MTDVKDLLDEAVGSFQPGSDERAVVRRVVRRRRVRRVAAGTVAIGAFALAGWFTWLAFGPAEPTPGAMGFGTYVLTDLEVTEHEDPLTEEVDPTQADVSFMTSWSTSQYPGAHRCELHVFGASGSQIGSLVFEMESLSQGRQHPVAVPVTAPIQGATARGTCDAERVDVPAAYVISDERAVYGRTLTIGYHVRWPDGLPSNARPSANACTAALWTEDGLAATSEFILSVGVGDLWTDAGIGPEAVPSHAGATVACEAYERDDVFPSPMPWPVEDPLPEVEVLLGAELAAALEVELHAWSVGSTIEVTEFGVFFDGVLLGDCAITPDLAVMVQQLGDGTFYCAVAETEIDAWVLAQRLAGHLPSEAQIEERRASGDRPRIGGSPEDVDGDGLISDSGLERFPELMRAAGDDGTLGYVRFDDLGGPEPTSPEEAAEMSGRPWVAPLYAEDGVTIIGRFTSS